MDDNPNDNIPKHMLTYMFSIYLLGLFELSINTKFIENITIIKIKNTIAIDITKLHRVLWSNLF